MGAPVRGRRPVSGLERGPRVGRAGRAGGWGRGQEDGERWWGGGGEGRSPGKRSEGP